MKGIIDQAWESLLQGVLKKGDPVRPGIGDGVDLYVPQSRILTLAESNPDILKSLYYAARTSGKRNAASIVSKLGMPADYFWKFEYWPKARAFEVLEKIVSRVFASIMRYAKEGELKIVSLEIDPLVIDISFANCAECAGFEEIGHNICYYHAGTLAGILSGLLNTELEAYESECHAHGAENCHFKIGDVSSSSIKDLFESYLSPPQVNTDMKSRLLKSLDKEQVRSLGNIVNVNYLQLAVANSLISNPEELAIDSYDTGFELGSSLAPLVSDYFGEDMAKMIEGFYLQLGVLEVEIKKTDTAYSLKISECAECMGPSNNPEMTAFLTGELCGLVSSVTKIPMQVTKSHIDGDDLYLTFTPER